MFPSSGTGVSGNFSGHFKGAKYLLHFKTDLGLLLRRCRGQGPHLGMMGESRGFSQGAAGFSSYDGEFRLPLQLAQGSPVFMSNCELELGIALETLQGQIDLI